MTKLNLLAIVACVGAIGLNSGVALSGATSMGTVCVARQNEQYVVGSPLYNLRSISSAVYGNPIDVVCPIIVDHDIGTTVQFKVKVSDMSDEQDFACNGRAYDSEGNLMGTTAQKKSSATGSQLLTLSLSNVNPGADWTFSMDCYVPNKQSELISVRAY